MYKYVLYIVYAEECFINLPTVGFSISVTFCFHLSIFYFELFALKLAKFRLGSIDSCLLYLSENFF